MVQNNFLSEYTTDLGSGCKILYGSHAASGYLLRIAAEFSVERPLHLLDFGNRCDMYYVARQLRFLTRDPAAAMANIRLQRAFTCYQAAALMRQMLCIEEGVPVIILDLLAPFLDENIKTAEINRLFHELVGMIFSIMEKNVVLIGVKPIPQKLAPDRFCLLNGLVRNFGVIAVPGQQLPAEHGSENCPSAYQMRPALRVFETARSSDISRRVAPQLTSAQPALFNLDADNP